MNNKKHKELSERIKQIHQETQNTRKVESTPNTTTFLNNSDILSIDCTTLFADFGGCTNLVDQHDRQFALWLLKSYLLCASTIIRDSGGVITSFEGDGLMAIFTGEHKEKNAVQCAFKIQWSMSNVIQPQIEALYPEVQYLASHVVGVDSSNLSAIRTGIWDSYDILWVGRSANYAANLTRIRDSKFSTYITSEVHSKLSTDLLGTAEDNFWDLMDSQVNDMNIFRSNKEFSIEVL